MRRFNTSGPNIPTKHYTLPRLDIVEEGVNKIHDERYFTIWAPRQTGKSTYFGLLADRLHTEGYKVAHVNFENYKEATLPSFLNEFHSRLKEGWGIDFAGKDLQATFSAIALIKDQKLVLIIDEVEGINPDFFGQFLHSIRHVYHSRIEHSLKSVVLVGVSNIIGVVQDNASPFNVTDNLNVPYFTDEEVLELLGQHETETGQLFDPSVKTKISEITANQPGLVNGFAGKLVEDHPKKAVIEYADYLIVEDWYLTEAIDKNVTNIVNKASQYRPFIERLLFTEAKVPFQINREPIKFLFVNGIIKKDKEGFVTTLIKVSVTDCSGAYMNQSGMCIGETVHEKAEVSITAGIENEMPMVWHEGIGKNAHTCFFFCIKEEFLEQLIVFCRFKDRQATVCTIDDVIWLVSNIDTSESGHEESISFNRDCPYFYPISTEQITPCTKTNKGLDA